MGFYIGLYNRGHVNSVEGWEDRKYVNNDKAFDILTDKPYEVLPHGRWDDEICMRTLDYDKAREKLKDLDSNSDIFIKLANIMEKDDGIYLYINN